MGRDMVGLQYAIPRFSVRLRIVNGTPRFWVVIDYVWILKYYLHILKYYFFNRKS